MAARYWRCAADCVVASVSCSDSTCMRRRSRSASTPSPVSDAVSRSISSESVSKTRRSSTTFCLPSASCSVVGDIGDDIVADIGLLLRSVSVVVSVAALQQNLRLPHVPANVSGTFLSIVLRVTSSARGHPHPCAARQNGKPCLSAERRAVNVAAPRCNDSAFRVRASPFVRAAETVRCGTRLASG
ncbi:protein of unknown function [Paraburkholderia kururiensis]